MSKLGCPCQSHIMRKKMTAREMFEELGYQRNEENEKIIYLIETKGSF